MKFAYQTKTSLVCVEHGFVVNKTRTSIKRTAQKKWSESVMLHISIIQMEKHIDVYYSSCLCAILLSMRFVKSVGNTHRTHTDYDWIVLWLAFCLICKFYWFWRSIQYLFRNLSLLAEAKCHAVWKMIVFDYLPVCQLNTCFMTIFRHSHSCLLMLNHDEWLWIVETTWDSYNTVPFTLLCCILTNCIVQIKPLKIFCQYIHMGIAF